MAEKKTSGSKPENTEKKITKSKIKRKSVKGLRKILSGILHIVCSRVVLFALLIALQVGLMLAWLLWLNTRVSFLYPFAYILAIIILITIVNRKWNPTFKLSWIIPILIFPVFGCGAYIFVQLQIGSYMLKKNIATITDKTKHFLTQDEETIVSLREADKGAGNLAGYVYEQAHAPVYRNSFAKYYSSGEEMFPDILSELESAQHFIFIEMFIVEAGKVWDPILEILKRKASEGVEVRLMYDGTNALATLTPGYYKKLRKMGIKSKPFSKMVPLVTTYQNNRDHRKIIDIDGRAVFTGGINFADEYMNFKKRYGDYWKDSGVMLRGEAVKTFTLMFLQNWNVREKTIDNFERYVCGLPQERYDQSGYMIGYGDTPFNDEEIAESVYMDIINSAKEYVHIITPYLVLDDQMQHALSYAAKRGVDVTIIMPGVADKSYVYCLSRTYYRDLIQAGVKIYEFTPGFSHAKMFTSDDKCAVVGSINLDFRSLYLHFECGVYFYDSPIVTSAEEDFQNTLKECNIVTDLECRNRPIWYKFCGKVLRLFAPLM